MSYIKYEFSRILTLELHRLSGIIKVVLDQEGEHTARGPQPAREGSFFSFKNLARETQITPNVARGRE